MCLVCVSWNKGLLTPEEALKNIGELLTTARENDEDTEHYFKVIDKILDEEQCSPV